MRSISMNDLGHALPSLPSTPPPSAPVRPLSVKLPIKAPRFSGFANLTLPTLAAPRGTWVRNPLEPPTPSLAGALPEIDQPVGPLMVQGKPYWPITIADLQPGDIGFDYRAVYRSARQRIIFLGECLQNITRPDRRGNPNILHAFVVLRSYPHLGKVRAADAATGEAPFGVVLADLDFANHQVKDAFHLFFRFRDPRMRQRMADVARNWSQVFIPNFSSGHAVRSIWQTRQISTQVQAQLLHLAKTNDDAVSMTGPDGSPYMVMCSEFVSDVGATAAMSLYVEDHPGVAPGDPETLRAVAQGPAGSVFNVNPASLTPSALAARLAADPAVEPVGYFYAFA